MSYVLASYGVTVFALVGYGAYIARQRRASTA